MKFRAIPVQQKGKKLYITSIPAKDLVEERKFTIAHWKHDEKDVKKQQGYQRELTPSHAKRVSAYLTETGKPHKNVLPGAILINSRTPLKAHNEKDGSVTVEISRYPVFIVDGQHRVSGLRHAIENGEDRLLDYELPIIISEFDLPEETLHFKTINKTAKPVNPELAQRLLRELTVGHNIDFGDDKDAWTTKALAALDSLNETSKSVWRNKIAVPGKTKNASNIARQNSFISSLKPLYGKDGRFADDQTTVDSAVKILSDFWTALDELLPQAFNDPKEYLIQRTPGLFSLHELLAKILKYQPAPSKQEFKAILKPMMESMDMDADYWRKGSDRGAAVYGSMKGFKLLYKQMAANLPSLLK